MAFRKLFLKELRGALPLYAVFCGAVLLLHLFLLYKNDDWDQAYISSFSLLLPYIFAGTMAVGLGYYQLHAEWRTNTVYLLLSLPVRGWKVLAAKLSATIALLAATSLWIAASYAATLLPTNWREMNMNDQVTESFPSLLNMAANALWMYLFFVAFFIVVVQFAFLCGQLVARFKWFVVFVSFFAALWLVIKLNPLLSDALRWTPEMMIGGNELEKLYMHSGPFIGLALLGAALAWLNGYIFEKEVEV
ncbi:hypothetical protein [Cohnella sp. GCM10027633]|uniref:hypothetical protein n=1 Tax=unclassified Cohnella TaxID=2636738 RepID=UPI00362FC629